MYDQLAPLGRHYATEEDIDQALFSGQLKGVETMFRDSILKAERDSDHDAYHHLSIKEAALPFYQLISEECSIDNISGAMQVYGDIGELLKKHLKNAEPQAGSSIAPIHRGQSSELVVYALLARDFSDISTRAPIPTRAIDDKAGVVGTDFILKPLYDPHQGEEWIQVKSSVTEKPTYHPFVSLIGLNQLDPEHFRDQWHNDALGQSILRELSGEATIEDVNKIDNATLLIYQLLDEQRESRAVGGRNILEIHQSLKGAWRKPGYRYTTASKGFDY